MTDIRLTGLGCRKKIAAMSLFYYAQPACGDVDRSPQRKRNRIQPAIAAHGRPTSSRECGRMALAQGPISPVPSLTLASVSTRPTEGTSSSTARPGAWCARPGSWESSGAGKQRLTPAWLEGAPADISPDGKEVLVASQVNTDSQSSVYTVKVRRQQLRRLTHPREHRAIFLAVTHPMRRRSFSPAAASVRTRVSTSSS
jgi:hypothetical protein